MNRSRERGFTLVEIMIVVAIIALLAAIAIPNVLRGRATANETAAIGNLRALVSSVEMYRAANNAYPSAWGDMDDATPPFYPQPFQTMGTVQGFTFAYTNVDANNYTMTAAPSSTSTGSRAFYTDEAALVRHCTGTGPADVGDRTIDAAPLAC